MQRKCLSHQQVCAEQVSRLGRDRERLVHCEGDAAAGRVRAAQGAVRQGARVHGQGSQGREGRQAPNAWTWG